MTPHVPSDQERLQALARGDRRVLDEIYRQYRDEFLGWAASRFGETDRQDLRDAWHDAMIVFYEQVTDGRLTTLVCALRTYLFTIGYRRMLTLHRKRGRTELQEDFHANEYIDETINVEEWAYTDDRCCQIALRAVGALPDQGRRILILRHLEGKTLDKIVAIMGYKSANAASVTLSRAMVAVRKVLREQGCMKKNGR